MEYWFTEQHTDNVRFSIRTDKQLASEETEIQRIDIFTSPEFGKFLVLDGCIMLTEKDEFIYHEMIVHVPMAVNPKIRKVLVIGAGDGGTIRELCRYETIEHIDMVEIDQRVVELCQEHFPNLSASLLDPRVNIYYEDGLKFIRSRKKEYDLIIVDSTDPFGPGEGLFTRSFYQDCHAALNAKGILVNQHESPFYDHYRKNMQRAHKRIVETFEIAKVYQAFIPTYASGHWLFGFASKQFDPIVDFKAEAFAELNLKTRYYNEDIHRASFALPNYVKEALAEGLKNE